MVSRSTVPQIAARPAARGRQGSLWIALCLVALQLVMALHFALVPHRFSAELAGFEHLHSGPVPRAKPAKLGIARPASSANTLAPSSASCATDSCPMGFAGHHPVLLTGDGTAELLPLFVTAQPAPSGPLVVARQRALLTAPKTSPPA